MPIRAKAFRESDEIENVRLGTREQWISDWASINDTETHTFNHPLDEIPWVVSVIYSETQQGYLARDATADVTVTKTDSAITVLNGIGNDDFLRYFQVRAM